MPGGRRRGSIHKMSRHFRWPSGYSGRIVGAAGHLHGGGRYVQLRDRTCRRNLVTSKAYYGMPNHEFYRVKPRLHEASPVRIQSKGTPTGIPVAGGDRVRLTAGYDNQYLHTRVMNIMGGFFVRDPSVKGCPRMPRDVQVTNRPRRFRARPPRYRVPLVKKPTGPFQRLGSSGIFIGGLFFDPDRVSIRAGQRITWRFQTRELHSVTVTQGPRGFSSAMEALGLVQLPPAGQGPLPDLLLAASGGDDAGTARPLSAPSPAGRPRTAVTGAGIRQPG